MSLLDTASLIVTPNAYKEGKLYSVIPSDGSGDMSVVRATTATRVNSAGLVELVPYNLFTYSEQFDNVAWEKGATTISANAITAPNGTLTADKISEDNANDIHEVRNLFTGGGTNTMSVYAKKAERDFICLFTGGGTLGGYFDLNNGTTLGTFGSVTTTIEDAGNGWYRCSLIFSLSGLSFGRIAVSNDGATLSYTGTTGSGVYIWGAQLNEGTLKDYQKTETRLNIPRLDYSNGTCPSLLVEPQRTNICRDSNNLSGGAWINESTNTTLTRIQSGGPDGNAFDRLVVGGSVGSYQGRYVQAASNVGANAVYSVYLKGSGQVSIQLYNGVSSPQIFVTLTNEWTRYNTVSTSGSGGYIDWNLFVFGGTTCDVAFHQLEFATYPTSYIPTTSASVTRNADVISKTGISSLIGQTEGTFFVDAYITGKSTSNGSTLFATDKVSSGAIMTIIYTASDALFFYVYDGSSFQCSLNGGSFNVGDRVKVACGYKNNDFVMYINGNLVATDTSGSVPATDTANINTSIYADNNGSFINAAALWKTRLTNDELATLTTI